MSYSILIVDDSPVVRHALRSSLERHPGWVVCGEAGDGREAIQKSKELNPDLIILDFSMPGMDGMTAARELNRAQPDVLLLMFTMFSNPLLEREARSAGCAAVVSKAEIEVLFRSLNRLLKDR